MKRTQIQLMESQARALAHIASRSSRSVADLIREGADWVIGRKAGDGSGSDVRRRAAAVSGRFRSAVRDLGRGHDRYFAEAGGGR